jgi:hypothetical protein
MAYILFNTKEEAIDRAEQAGINLNLSYHRDGNINGTRYAGIVFKTTSGKYAWEIVGDITSAENLAKVSTATEETSEANYEQIVFPG